MPIYDIFNVLAELGNFTIDKNGNVKIVEPINITTIDTHSGVMSLFFRLINHYFVFRYKSTGIRKNKCKRVELFNISENDKNYKPIKLTNSKDSNRMDRYVGNYLTSLASDNPRLFPHVHEIQVELSKKYRFRIEQHADVYRNKNLRPTGRNS